MREFFHIVRNRIDHDAGWSEDRHREFVQTCEQYIKNLKKKGKLIGAQPLVREGVMLSRSGTSWIEDPLGKSGEVQVGYYHIKADSLEDAVAIAKDNPEFAFSQTARIEVRPLHVAEESTGFVYPGKE